VGGGPAAHKIAISRAAAAEKLARRRRAAWDLFVGERLTFLEIGARLGVSNKTAWEDVVAHRDALVREQLLDPDMARSRQIGGIAALVQTHWKSRRKKNSADVILAAWTREAKLLGLDARQDVYSADQVAAVLRGIAGLFMEIVADPEQRRQFSIGLRRKVGALAAQAGINGNGNGGNGHGAKPVGHGSTAPPVDVGVGAGPEKEQQA
jgi:hypothetical protein